jgi:acyl-CoA reductase-like NAD-dependent aldehyde dehydrogenase
MHVFIAANWTALGFLYNTGQDCTAGSRVYVQESVYDKFLSLLINKAKQVIVGDGFDDVVTNGPVVNHVYDCWRRLQDSVQVSKLQYDKIWSYIDHGKSEGARVVLGGERRSGKGFFVDPTSKSTVGVYWPVLYSQNSVFVDIRSDMKIVGCLTLLTRSRLTRRSRR